MRTAEAWHCVAELESLKRAQERLLEKVLHIFYKGPEFLRCQCHGLVTKKQNQQLYEPCESLEDKMCVPQRAELEK